MRGPGWHRSTALDGARIVELEEFERCFETNFAFVHRFIARRVGIALADDLTAETFATAFRRRHSFDPGLGPERSWLLGIANNVVRGHWRAEQRLLGLNLRLERQAGSTTPEAGPEESAGASELAPMVARALASLPAEQRDVLLLYAGANCRRNRSLPLSGSLPAQSARGCGAPALTSAPDYWGRTTARAPACTHTAPQDFPTLLTISQKGPTMADEIELVRHFRSDVPEPSPEVRARLGPLSRLQQKRVHSARCLRLRGDRCRSAGGQWWHWRRS